MGNSGAKIAPRGSLGSEEISIESDPGVLGELLVNSLLEESKKIDLSAEQNVNNIIQFQNLGLIECLLRYGFPFTIKKPASNENDVIGDIMKFNNDLQAKTDFLRIGYVIFKNSDELPLFQAKYNDYNAQDILDYYLKKGSFYKILNYCLQTPSLDSIKYCRYVLRDLSRAIANKYLSSNNRFKGLLYSDIYLNSDKWASLEFHIGKEIEVDRFFSASKVKSAPDTNKSVKVTIITMGPPHNNQTVQPAEEQNAQGFLELENENDVLFNIRSKFLILDANTFINDNNAPHSHLILLYGKNETQKYIEKFKPTIQVKRTNIHKKKCQNCKNLLEELLTEYLFIDLQDQEYFICTKCVFEIKPKRKSPLLILSPHILENMTPDGSDTPALSLPGLIIDYPEEPTLSFYGYKCANILCRREGEGLSACFKCVTCCSPQKEWCGATECRKGREECLEKGHNVILERSPYSYWYKKSASVSLPKNNDLRAPEEDQQLETAQYFDEEANYEENNFEFYPHRADQILIANSYCKAGSKHFAQENYQRAKHFHKKALGIRENLYTGNHLHLAISYENLGLSCHFLGETDESFRYQGKALQIRKFIHTAGTHYTIADSLNNVGMVYHTLTFYERAAENVSEALKIRLENYPYNHEKMAIYNNNLGIIYNSWGKSSKSKDYEEKAKDYFEKAQEIWKALGKEGSLAIGKSYLELGLIYKNKKDYINANELIEKALAILQTYQLPSCELVIAEISSHLGDIKKYLNQHEDAIEKYKKALRYYEKSECDYCNQIATVYKNLGEIYFKRKEYEMTKTSYLKAKEFYEKIDERKSGHLASHFGELGLVYQIQESYEEAKQMFTIARDINLSQFGKDHFLTKHSIKNLEDLVSEIERKRDSL